MKTLVVYTSQTGFTKRYAQWIAERMEADLFVSGMQDIPVAPPSDATTVGEPILPVSDAPIDAATHRRSALYRFQS